MTDRVPGFSTLAVHAGAQPDAGDRRPRHARSTRRRPSSSTTWTMPPRSSGPAGLRQHLHAHRRIPRPAPCSKERVAALEGGTAALAVASGHAAESSSCSHAAAAGRRVRRRQQALRRLDQTSSDRCLQELRLERELGRGSMTQPLQFERRPSRRATKAIFIEGVHRQSRRRHLRHRRHSRRSRRRAARAAHRRQYAWRRPTSSAPSSTAPTSSVHSADAVPRRARQFHRRRHRRRRRHVRLAGIGQALSRSLAAAPGIRRQMIARRDLRQFRLPRSPAACWACATSARLHLAVRLRSMLLAGIETLPLRMQRALRQRARRSRSTSPDHHGGEAGSPIPASRRTTATTTLAQRYCAAAGRAQVFTFGLKGGDRRRPRPSSTNLQALLPPRQRRRSRAALVVHPASTTQPPADG